MKVKSIKAIACPECDGKILVEDIPVPQEFFQCGECDEMYEDREEAKECCKE